MGRSWVVTPSTLGCLDRARNNAWSTFLWKDKGDANVTYVSTCGLQSQSNKGNMKAKQSSQNTDKSHESDNSHDE